MTFSSLQIFEYTINSIWIKFSYAIDIFQDLSLCYLPESAPSLENTRLGLDEFSMYHKKPIVNDRSWTSLEEYESS